MLPSLVAVIDDDELVRNATASLIRSLGHDVMQYVSAEEFLTAGVYEVDCVLTDLQMPGLSGLELCRELIAREIWLPMILMTAYPTREARARISELGVSALMEKPVDPEVLAIVIQEALA